MDDVDPVRIVQPIAPAVDLPKHVDRTTDSPPKRQSRDDSYEFHQEDEEPDEATSDTPREQPPGESHLDLSV